MSRTPAGSPLRGLRSSPSIGNLRSKRSPMAIEQHALHFRRDNRMEGTVGFQKQQGSYEMRARSFSKGTRSSIRSEPRISLVVGASQKYHQDTPKTLPFRNFNYVPSVNPSALARPSATKYDNTYLSAFAGSPTGQRMGGTAPSGGFSGVKKRVQGELFSLRKSAPTIDTHGRGRPMGDDAAMSLFDSATGMKLQMLKMVRDLNTNQSRSDSARGILRDIGSDPNKDHVDEKIFVNFYNNVQAMKEGVGQEISEVRSEMRDIFAMLDSDRQLMEEDLHEMETEGKEMQRVVTKMDAAVCGLEVTLFRGQVELPLIQQEESLDPAAEAGEESVQSLSQQQN